MAAYTRLWALALLLAPGCVRGEPEPASRAAQAATAQQRSAPVVPSSAVQARHEPASRRVKLIVAGDISFGREPGQVLLRDPQHAFFSNIGPWLRTAEVRVANLESPLTDRHGETQSPEQELVFAGPPSGADALARAGFDVVTLANNHAWDYGKKGFLETLEHLERVGVGYVGAGRDRARAYGPVLIDRGAVRVALLAVTDIWNQGALRTHKAAEFVAGPDRDTLVESIRGLRADSSVDAIVVHHHGGCEFVEHPLSRTRALAHAAIDAGADAVLGDHPHVVQGIEWYRDRPIVYSLGNLMMQLRKGRPREGTGMLARLEVGARTTPALWVCPFRIEGTRIQPFTPGTSGEARERRFLAHLTGLSAAWGGVSLLAREQDGCWQVAAPAQGPALAFR